MRSGTRNITVPRRCSQPGAVTGGCPVPRRRRTLPRVNPEAQAERTIRGLEAPVLLEMYRHIYAAPADRRQGDPAQAAEPDLLPDLRRGTRGRPGRGGPAAEAGRGLVLLLLPGPGALPGSRNELRRHAPPGGGRSRGPAVRGPADAVSLGVEGAEHRLHLEPHRHAIPECGRVRRSRLADGADPGARGSRRARRNRHGDLRGRDDQRRRVLGIPQHGLQPQAARPLPDRGQWLRDQRARRGADGGGIDLEARAQLPESAHRGSRRLRSDRVLRSARPRDRVVPRPQRPGARARAGHPAVLPLPFRRRAHVPAGSGARRGGRTRPLHDVPATARRGRDRHGGRAAGDPRGDRSRDRGRHGARARRSRSPLPRRRSSSCTHRTSTRRRTRSRASRSSRARPRRWSIS